MNISPKSGLSLFDSFAIAELKEIMAKEDKKITKKVLKGIEKMDRIDQKLTSQRLKFSMQGYKKLTNNKMLTFLETVKDFVHVLESFGKNENIKSL